MEARAENGEAKDATPRTVGYAVGADQGFLAPAQNAWTATSRFAQDGQWNALDRSNRGALARSAGTVWPLGDDIHALQQLV